MVAAHWLFVYLTAMLQSTILINMIFMVPQWILQSTIDRQQGFTTPTWTHILASPYDYQRL